MQKHTRMTRKGFTLIEMLVVLAVFAITTTAFYRAYSLAVDNIIEAKRRLAATNYANEIMETFRNMEYVDIVLDPGTNPPTGSVVSGTSGTGIDYDETVDINDVRFRTQIEIYYIDDPFDNTGTDAIPNDYKDVKITVFWGNGVSDTSNEKQRISLASYFIPPSGSELAVLDGVMSVNVVDSDGNPVNAATVSVTDTNGATAPNYSDSGNTDADGNILFLGMPAGEEVYRVTASKAGYETVPTMPPYPTTSYYPIYVDSSIIDGTITTLTIVIDQTPDFDMYSMDPFCNPIPNRSFTMSGGRILGTTTGGDNVYINDSLSVSTNGSGYANLAAVSGYQESAGRYEVTTSDANYTFWKLNPGDDIDRNATHVVPGVTYDCNYIVMDNTVDSVFVQVTDATTSSALSGATVRLENTALGYDVEQVADIYGMVYFPENEGEPLVAGQTYTLTVIDLDYNNDVSTVTVSGLEEVSVTLNPS